MWRVYCLCGEKLSFAKMSVGFKEGVSSFRRSRSNSPGNHSSYVSRINWMSRTKSSIADEEDTVFASGSSSPYLSCLSGSVRKSQYVEISIDVKVGSSGPRIPSAMRMYRMIQVTAHVDLLEH